MSEELGRLLSKDPLGDRMKRQYEDRTRYLLPRRTYTIVRIDGRAFHTYTRPCVRPFDQPLTDALLHATLRTLEAVQGAQFAYQQSDEISFLLTDFETTRTEATFDGNIQKIVSVMASTFTAHFNSQRDGWPLATFDARAFTVPDRAEVANYFVWRQKDAEKNSLQMVAREHFSHKELYGKSQSNMHDMLHEKGVNWNDVNEGHKRGYWVRRDYAVEAAPIFTASRETLMLEIPEHPGYGMTLAEALR